MELTKVECPFCGGYVVVDDRDTCFCSYCGRQLSVKGRNISKQTIEKTITIRDEAKIKEIELLDKQAQRVERETSIVNKKEINFARIVCLVSLALWVIAILAVGIVDSDAALSFVILIFVLPVVCIVSLIISLFKSKKKRK